MDGDPRQVLIVDDDPDMLAIAQLALADIGGLTTCTAQNGGEALVARATHDADLILMDLRLEREDGQVVWRALNANSAVPLHVIFVTGARADEVAGLEAETGFLGIISKPFDPIGLAENVRQLWKTRP
ncbi:response regulator [Rhodospirillum sp. A1_3_36]|uniref:response regulator n=1 Tax=Rhodospirillum sp. A1_3_36 TaxID=3391666 RepID=UPI0039A63AEE